jgi:thymidylate synthase (FAD)
MANIKVDYIEHMGNDLTVVNAARVSFDKESEAVDWYDTEQSNHYFPLPVLDPKDIKLIKYLAKHNHWSPFSHCFIQFRIKAPIFVARQLMKHTVGLAWNEVSRRYVDSKPEFYQPTYFRRKAPNVKQGSSSEPVKSHTDWNATVDKYTAYMVTLYELMLKEGICPEQARMILPQSMMTEWYWSGSLYAFARVCHLRLAKEAQAETRIVAENICRVCSEVFPNAWDALMNGDEDE